MGHCFFFKAGHILWFVSAGHENAAECMAGVREKYRSQAHEALRINLNCHSLCKLFLPVLSQRWLPESPAMCMGMGGWEEQAGVFVLCVVGYWCCQERRRQFICSGGFRTACEPLCCVSQILFFSMKRLLGYCLGIKAVGLQKLQLFLSSGTHSSTILYQESGFPIVPHWRTSPREGLKHARVSVWNSEYVINRKTNI